MEYFQHKDHLLPLEHKDKTNNFINPTFHRRNQVLLLGYKENNFINPTFHLRTQIHQDQLVPRNQVHQLLLLDFMLHPNQIRIRLKWHWYLSLEGWNFSNPSNRSTNEFINQSLMQTVKNISGTGHQMKFLIAFQYLNLTLDQHLQ